MCPAAASVPMLMWMWLPGASSIVATPISFSAPLFGGSAGPLIGIGALVNVTFTVNGTSLVPTVTLFNGARAAVTSDTASTFTFAYTLQSNDTGPIVYMVQARDQSSAITSTIFIDDSRAAGKSCEHGLSWRCA